MAGPPVLFPMNLVYITESIQGNERVCHDIISISFVFTDSGRKIGRFLLSPPSGYVMEILDQYKKHLVDVFNNPAICIEMPHCGIVVREIREHCQARAATGGEGDLFSQRTVADMTYMLGETKIGYDRTTYRLFEEGEVSMTPRLNTYFLQRLLEYLECTESQEREVVIAWWCGWILNMTGEQRALTTRGH
jgi:hypothetical protein